MEGSQNTTPSLQRNDQMLLSGALLKNASTYRHLYGHQSAMGTDIYIRAMLLTAKSKLLLLYPLFTCSTPRNVPMASCSQFFLVNTIMARAPTAILAFAWVFGFAQGAVFLEALESHPPRETVIRTETPGGGWGSPPMSTVEGNSPPASQATILRRAI